MLLDAQNLTHYGNTYIKSLFKFLFYHAFTSEEFQPRENSIHKYSHRRKRNEPWKAPTSQVTSGILRATTTSEKFCCYLLCFCLYASICNEVRKDKISWCTYEPTRNYHVRWHFLENEVKHKEFASQQNIKYSGNQSITLNLIVKSK